MSQDFEYSAYTGKCAWSIECLILTTNNFLWKWQPKEWTLLLYKIARNGQKLRNLWLWGHRKPTFSLKTWFLGLDYETSRPLLPFKTQKVCKIQNIAFWHLRIIFINLAHSGTKETSGQTPLLTPSSEIAKFKCFNL